MCGAPIERKALTVRKAGRSARIAVAAMGLCFALAVLPIASCGPTELVTSSTNSDAGQSQQAAPAAPHAAGEEAAGNAAPTSTEQHVASAPAAASEAKPASGTAIVATEASGGDEAFALWAKGRVAVTDPDTGELLFEADPGRNYTGIWSSLGVDGGLVVRGTGELGSVVSDGDMSAAGDLSADGKVTAQGNIETSGAVASSSVMAREATLSKLDTLESSLGAAKASSVESDSLHATSAKADDLQAQAVEADVAAVQSLTGENGAFSALQAEELGAGTFSATGIESDTLHAKNVSSDEIDAGSLVASSASIETLSAHSLGGGDVDVATVEAGSASFQSANVDAIEAGGMHSSSIEAGSIDADSIEADGIHSGTVSASAMSADSASFASIEGRFDGVLARIALDAESCGHVTFPAVEADGSGYVDAVAIQVPEGTTAVFVQPGATDGDWIAAWGVEQASETEWKIACRYPKAALAEMEGGVFSPVGETVVYWVAISGRQAEP